MTALTDRRTEGAASTPPAARGPFWKMGSWCARYCWVVILAWIVILVGSNVASGALGGTYNAQVTLTNSPAQTGADLLTQHAPGGATGTPSTSPQAQGGTIVFHVSAGTLAPDRAPIESSVAATRHLAGVASVSDPFATLSPNGRAAIATIVYKTSAPMLGNTNVTATEAAVEPATKVGVSVDYGSDLGAAAGPSSSNTSSDVIGVGVAIILLLLAFGSVLATLLPVISAVIGVFAGLGTLGILSAGIAFPSESPTIALMMGLGVGIDYALFLATRFRQLIIEGVEPNDAVGRTVAASGRAIVIAAVTVVVSLVGLYASGIVYIGQLGVSAGIVVAVAALSGITLMPALLGVAGRRIDVVRIRRHPIAEPSGDATSWSRYGNGLARHPVVFLVAACSLLVVLAIPVLSLRLGTAGGTALSSGTSERRAYEAVSTDFGAGYPNPLTIVVEAPPRASTTELATIGTSLRRTLGSTPGVASVTAFAPTPDRALLVGTVVPTTDESTPATRALLDRLNTSVLPSALSRTGIAGATGYVTGSLALADALSSAVTSSLPAVIAVVVAAAMILILMTFRSPLLALKAGVINVLSIGASYGILVAVFQWGWGSQVFGLPQGVPIVSFVPMLMFAIVFGLSMDYEVFLLARIREAFVGGASNKSSIVHGLAVTGRIITCAALIMACVFFSFLLLPSATIKMLALGLGVSVLVDATVVRLVIVPCAMLLFGKANWWIPRRLDRLLPHLEP